MKVVTIIIFGNFRKIHWKKLLMETYFGEVALLEKHL